MFGWTGFLTYAFITAFTPGPNNIMSMSNGSRLGFRKALPFNFGILTGFAAVMAVCTLFCSLLTDLLPKIRLPMLILGAAYMLYLAWKTFKSSPEIDENHSGGGYVSGLLLQFVNVKIFIYCIVSMEAYVLPFFAGQPLRVAAFGAFLVLLAFASTLCWSAFGSVFKLLFSRYARITNTVMALLLVYCAASLFI